MFSALIVVNLKLWDWIEGNSGRHFWGNGVLEEMREREIGEENLR